jgi:hypothetical protein
MLPGMPTPPAPAQPPPWRRALRHATTLALFGLVTALVAPTVATLLLALRGNGPSFELAYALMLAPWAILLGGPGAFVLGAIFGWMVLVLASQNLNRLETRLALAVLVATIAWWLAEPLPQHEGSTPLMDWLTWALSAAATAPIFTRAWVAHRLTHPVPVPED